MKTTRRRASPLPTLLLLALLLFSAGLMTGWAGVSVVQFAAGKDLSVPNPVPGPSQLVEPPSTYPLEEPSPASADNGWALRLVNFETPLPDGAAAPELTQLRNGNAIDSRAYPDLQRMMDDCRAAGLQPLICSSYRSEETQRKLFERETQNWLSQGYTRNEAETQAALWVARPGTSEHQTGLAVDIVDTSYQTLDQGQENTAVQRWLMAHCAEYGFILRYPTDKSALTGVNYEPWHYRYVGVEAAQNIMGGGLCLEEYLQGQGHAQNDRLSGNIPVGESGTDWGLTLVNYENAIPENREINLVEVSGGEKVDERIYDSLTQLLEAARESNLGQLPMVVSGYRTQATQQQFFDEKVAKYQNEGHSKREAVELAKQWVAAPGYSEHQIGLAVDINRATYDLYPWLQENSYKYGFIFRYPADKTNITGVAEEIWHYRYVGVKAATEMYERGLCLEEYLLR